MKQNILVILLISGYFFGCAGDSTVKSSDYSDRAARIERLAELFVLRSEVIDTAYEIYDVNMNTRSIPGPTDRDYRIILKVDPRFLQLWHDPDLVTSLSVDYLWAEPILKHTDGFDLSGKATQFVSENKQMIIFEETGVILVHLLQH